MASRQTARLQAIAQRIADLLPETVDEVVLTGSVSRGMADELSDIEMLLVPRAELELDECYALAAACGLTNLGSWGVQGLAAKRVSGLCDGAPIELIWWPRAFAEAAVDAIFAGELSPSAEAIANGVPLQTSGLLAEWQERLRVVPENLASQWIEEAALKWGGFYAGGLLTVVRPGARLPLLEWLVDDAGRVARIVFLLNGEWPPTTKRLAERVAPLEVKPDRLAERIEAALTDPDPRRALLAMLDLELETLALAAGGEYVNRARVWLAEGRRIVAGA